jgi:hypothetical protein
LDPEIEAAFASTATRQAVSLVIQAAPYFNNVRAKLIDPNRPQRYSGKMEPVCRMCTVFIRRDLLCSNRSTSNQVRMNYPWRNRRNLNGQSSSRRQRPWALSCRSATAARTANEVVE